MPNTPRYLRQTNDAMIRQLDYMTDEEREAEHAKFKETFGDYMTKGWFETTNRPTEEEWPPSTEDWDRYAFFQNEEPIARCAAYCDECAREFATILEERLNIPEVEIYRVTRIDRRNYTPDFDQKLVRGIAFTISRRGPDGFEIPFEEWEPNFLQVVNLVREHNLPDVMDKWKAWHDGAYYIGPPDVVDRITELLYHEVPDIGMGIFAGFPHEFYMTPGDPRENARKYMDAPQEEADDPGQA